MQEFFVAHDIHRNLSVPQREVQRSFGGAGRVERREPNVRSLGVKQRDTGL